MPDPVKVSALPDATSLDETESLLLVQWGVTKKAATSLLRTHRVVATASLPAAAAAMDGHVLIEDAAVGDRNLIIYAGGQRFRIDGGAAF